MRVYMVAQLYYRPSANATAIMREFCPGPPGRLSALSVFRCKSVLYGAFVWTRRALDRRKRRFPARVVDGYYTAQAAPFLLAHMELYHAAVEAAGWHVCASDNYLAPFFEPRAVTPALPPIALTIKDRQRL
jgi:hypothetical protein